MIALKFMPFGVSGLETELQLSNVEAELAGARLRAIDPKCAGVGDKGSTSH